MDVEATIEVVKDARLKSPRFHTPGPVSAISTPPAMRSPPASAPT